MIRTSRSFAKRFPLQLTVASAEYRPAPGAQHPGLLEDCYAGLGPGHIPCPVNGPRIPGTTRKARRFLAPCHS